MKSLRKYGTRILSVIMIMVFLVSITFQAKATDSETTPNILIYDSLLNDRSWVIDTFTRDTFPSSNPHAGSNGVSGMDYMYKDVLDKYASDSIFKAGVDLYYSYEHKEEALGEIPDSLINIFTTDASWTKFCSGVTSKNYSAVLSKVFSSDYESESGATLNSTLSDLQLLRSCYSTASSIKSSYKDVDEWLGLIEDVNDTFQYEYVMKVLPEYSDHIYGYIDGIDSVLNDASATTGKKVSDFNNLFEAQYYALYGSEDDSFNTWRTSLDIGKFADSMSKYLKVAKTTASVSTTCLDNITLLECLFEQRDSLSDTLKRTQGYASGERRYISVSNQYLNMMSNEYNDYDSILIEACKNTLNSEIQSKLNKYIWKKAEKGIKSSMTSFLARNAVSKEASSVFIATKAESMSSLLGIGTFLTDQVTGFGDTCEKIYELKYLDRIKGYAIETYREDAATYKRAQLNGASYSVLDEYAKNALDDLAFLQKLTLRENEIAYKMMTKQSDSYVGRLFDAVYGGNTSVDLDYMWTKVQNALVDTTINPISQTPMEIKSGETLTVYKTASDYWGVYEKSGGKKVTLAEIEYRLLGGLDLNGGAVVFVNQTTEDIYVNCLNVSSSSTVMLRGDGNVLVGNIGMAGSLSLDRDGESWLKTVGDLTIESGRLNVGAGRVEVGGDLAVKDWGSITMSDETGYVQVNGDAVITGNGRYGDEDLSRLEKGTLELKGGLMMEGDYYRAWCVDSGFKMVFSGEEKQKVSIGKYDSNGRSMLGDVTVSGAGLTTDTGFAAYKLESDIGMEGDAGYLHILDWNGYVVKNLGTVTLSGSNDENGGIRLECTGNVGSKGSSYVGNGYIKAGDNLTISDGRLNVGAGQVEVGGDLAVKDWGAISMSDETGHVQVNGDAVITGNGRYGDEDLSRIEKGTLELKGGLMMEGDYYRAWCVDSGFKMVFSGEEKQKVSIGKYDSNGRSMLGDVTVSGAGLTTDTGFAAYKLESDINMEGEVGYFYANNWNDKTVTLSNQSTIPTVSLVSGYGQLISCTTKNEDFYNITYAPCTTTYTCKYYVGISLKKTITQYQTGSLAIPYQVTVSSGQEFAGWYTDKALTNPWDIKKDTITEDISLYAKIIVPVTGIELQESLTLEGIGSESVLHATVLPSNATEKDVVWSSSNEAVATVSDTGEVKAVSVGKAIITARAGNKEAFCSVEVKEKNIGETPEEPVKVLSIKITAQPDRLIYKAGEYFNPTGLKVAANYSDGTTKEITDYTIEPANKALSITDTEITIRYTQDENSFTVMIPIQVIEESSGNVVINELKLKDTYGTIEGTTITVVLPADREVDFSAEDITIQGSDPDIRIQNVWFDNADNTWKLLAVTEEDTAGTEYTLNIRIAENEEEYKTAQWNVVEIAVSSLDYKDILTDIFTDKNSDAITQEEIAEKLASAVSQIPAAEWAGITVSVEDIHVSDYTPPTDGDADTPEGNEGSFAFAIHITDGAHTIDTDLITCKLAPAEYTGVTNAERVRNAVALIQTAEISLPNETVASQEMAVAAITKQVNQLLIENGSDIQITDADVTVLNYLLAENGTDGKITCKIQIKSGKSQDFTQEISFVIPASKIQQHTHNYITVTQTATVSANGSITEKCSICGETKNTTIIYSPKSIIVQKQKYTYDGKQKKPSVTVKDSQGKTVSNSYYTVSYKNNKNIGSATIIVTFREQYSGQLTASFTINPKPAAISKLSAVSKGFKLKWKKDKTISGYEIQYSTSSKFKGKSTKILSVKKSGTTSKTVKKLTARKKYYVRIRTYKTIKGKKYYSDWSKTKSVKTKK